MQNSSIEQELTTPPEIAVEPDVAELEAIIKEARARTRRRRIKLVASLAAGAAVVGACWWGFGGGGGDAPDPGDAGAPVQAASQASDAQAADACPSGREHPHVYKSSRGVRVCDLEIGADLPQGWRQRGTHLEGMPDLGNTVASMMMTAVSFGDFGLPANPYFDRPRPGPGEILLYVYPGYEEGDPAQGRAAERPLEPDDFRGQPLGATLRAEAEIYRGGWHFGVGVTAGAPLSAEAIEQANALLASISVIEHLP